MTSSYFSVSLSSVQHLGGRLVEIASTVSSGAAFPGPNGAEAYEDITSALADFKEDWDNAVARLEDTTRGLGQKAAAAATTMAEHDAALAASYRGE
jgi:hypothetical protein